MDNFSVLFQQIVDHPLASTTVILNLILIESLLSIDNAAVLATMVMALPARQRRKALKYGIIGAYVFRGLCLFFAAVLIQIWWFKPLGGAYLIFLAMGYFLKMGKKAPEAAPELEVVEKKKSWWYRKTLGAFGPFWATVVLVEIMDLAFSIDNVIAANAYTNNLILIWVGVFIGILAMRFVAQGFVRLIEKYPFLTVCAYLVILILGLKLCSSLFTHFQPCHPFTAFMEGPQPCLKSQGSDLPPGEHPLIWGDLITSLLSLGIFLIPVLSSLVLGFPRPRHHELRDMSEDQEP